MRQTGSLITIMLFLFFMAGCGAVSEQERERLLSKDPSFKHVLAEKERISGKIRSLQESLQDKKKALDGKVNSLRKDFYKEKADIDAELRRLRHKFGPELNQVRNEIKRVKREIASKEDTLANLEKTVKELEGLIEKEGTVDISRGEIVRWRHRITSLENDKNSILKELRVLRDDLDLLQIKYRLLR